MYSLLKKSIRGDWNLDVLQIIDRVSLVIRQGHWTKQIRKSLRERNDRTREAI